MTIDPAATESKDSHFWQVRRICFLATQRPDGSPHLVPVGATFDAETGIARIISSAGTRNVRNVLAAGSDVVVAVSQVEGRRWSTLEGKALIKSIRNPSPKLSGAT